MMMQFLPGETNIICTNLQNSLHFYRDVLGFEVVGHRDKTYHLRCGNQSYVLMPVAQILPTLAPYCSIPTISFDLQVSDLRAACEYLKAHEVAFEKDFDPSRNSFFIRDPDGLVIEITKMLS